jgi:hypothetical protein
MDGMRKTYDDVGFDKARDCVENTLCAVGLFLAPEGETLGKVFITKRYLLRISRG